MCRTRGRRPVVPAGRSSRSPAEGSASPAWGDPSGNRPAYPPPLLGNVGPAVLLPQQPHLEGVVKGMTPRIWREYEYWRPLYVRTCSYEYLLWPPEPRSAIVTQDAHERSVFPVGAAALPVFRPLQALERGRLVRQGATVPDVLPRLHLQVGGRDVAQPVVQRQQQLLPGAVGEGGLQPLQRNRLVGVERSHGRSPQGRQVPAAAQPPSQVVGQRADVRPLPAAHLDLHQRRLEREQVDAFDAGPAGAQGDRAAGAGPAGGRGASHLDGAGN